MARRTKYTPETVQKLTDALKLGATYELACGYAGISTDSFARWLDRYADFAERIALAEGDGAVQCLARIHKAATDGDWRAAAWVLEHRHPEQYGRSVQEHRHSFAVRREAERIAAALGLSVEEVLAEAQDILKGG